MFSVFDSFYYVLQEKTTVEHETHFVSVRQYTLESSKRMRSWLKNSTQLHYLCMHLFTPPLRSPSSPPNTETSPLPPPLCACRTHPKRQGGGIISKPNMQLFKHLEDSVENKVKI